MKVRGLDGKIYTMPLTGYRVDENDLRERSNLHLLARQLLKEEYPIDNILEEVYLPGTSKLYVDFFLPLRKFMVEVQGEQHYKFNKHFHQNKASFKQSIIRDNNKRQWCRANNIYLVEFPYSETVDEWRIRIRER